MSEIGKLFDRMLDYKFKEEWDELKKLEQALSPSEGLYKQEIIDYLNNVKDKKGIYDFEVIKENLDGSIDYKYNSISPIKCITFEYVKEETSGVSKFMRDWMEIIKNNDTT